MSTLNIGLSGLQVNQRLLDLTGQNISNADTPSYHRQVANLAELAPNANEAFAVGSGVEITGLSRAVNQALERAIVGNTSNASGASEQLDGLDQLQSYLATGSGTLHDSLSNLFTQLSALSTKPDDVVQRQVTLAAANDVTTQLNQTIDNIDTMGTGLRDQATSQANAINALTAQIADLNQKIHDGNVAGADVNGLLDLRDQSLASLADLTNVQTLQQPYGQISIFTNGIALVLGNQAAKLSTAAGDNGDIIIQSSNSLQPVAVTGGRLGATLALFNAVLPGVRGQVNTFATALATQFDEIHATGLGLGGPMTFLASQRTLTNVNQPLASAKLGFPPQAGNLYITVTNQATGQKTLHKLAIDPKTQSLSNIATAISAIPNLQAVVDPQAGSLTIMAANGYGFEFTGNVSTSPDTQAITGSVAPTISGRYTGSADDTLTFRFTGTGTIGATPGLMLEARNGSGALVASLNVGQGYEPGSDLPAVLGIKAKIPLGTVNSGDQFTLTVAADPDSAHLLSALGLNTFFVGSNANSLTVNPGLAADPTQLALSATGQPGDGANLARLINLQTQPTMSGGTQTLQQYLEGIIGSIGSQASATQTDKSAYDSLGQQLNTQLQGISGVDPNQELMNLVNYQRAYQMSAQFISTVNQTFDSLLKIF